MRFQKPLNRFVCSNITMTFKVLYKCYARRGPIGAGSKGQETCAPLELFSPLNNLGPLLALGSNNKYRYSSGVASEGTHPGAQDLGVQQHTFCAVILNVFLSRNLDQSMLKNAYFWGESCKNRLRFGGSDPSVLTPACYYNFVEFVSSAKCIFFRSKKKQITTANILPLLLLHLFFNSISVSFVEGGRKIISCPRAHGTLVTPLLKQNNC